MKKIMFSLTLAASVLAGCADPIDQASLRSATPNSDYIVGEWAFGRRTNIGGPGSGVIMGLEQIEGNAYLCGGRWIGSPVGARFLNASIIYFEGERIASGTGWMTQLNDPARAQATGPLICRPLNRPWTPRFDTAEGLRIDLPRQL